MTVVAERQDSSVDPVGEEDQARAQIYQLLAGVLSAPPQDQMLKSLASLAGGVGAFGEAIRALAREAGRVDAASLKTRYEELFIGLGRGELVPYGSYYLTGFLQEKPLAHLRRDMAKLGLARAQTVSDPEDHAASVLEMMAGLIDGRYGHPAEMDVQKEFYERHLGAWLPVFFRDLAGSQACPFYSAVGAVGRAFFEIEDSAFEMV